MLQIELTPEEQNLLVELLDDDAGDLREEIGRTDDHNYRQMLQDREALLTRLLAQLRQSPGAASGPA